ncbi:nuclease [Candidatus Magnetoovum chiemensis]|nr:nuclease [Candidatus Magnetoovum chiemensis]
MAKKRKKLQRKNHTPLAVLIILIIAAYLYSNNPQELIYRILPQIAQTLPNTSKYFTPYKETITALVLSVHDGDTASLKPTITESFKCRLYGIDAPEIGTDKWPKQQYSIEARDYLRALIKDKTVDVVLTGEKTYDRLVCIIYKDKLDINLEMIKKGYAWAYREHLKMPYSLTYTEAEKEAKDKKIGLWQPTVSPPVAPPEPPWIYRNKFKN